MAFMVYNYLYLYKEKIYYRQNWTCPANLDYLSRQNMQLVIFKYLLQLQRKKKIKLN